MKAKILSKEWCWGGWGYGDVVDVKEDPTDKYKLRVKDKESGEFIWGLEKSDVVIVDDTAKPSQEDHKPSQVNHPSHYNSGRIEVIEFIEDQGLNFSRGNGVKYIARKIRVKKSKILKKLFGMFKEKLNY